MVDVKKIVDIVNKLGYKTYHFDYSIYNGYIRNMLNWYKGYDSGFHTYKQFNGIKESVVDKARLNMAKRVCEDLASLTVNENIVLGIDDNAVKELLLGNNEMTGLLGENNFWANNSKLYEITCALGTGAVEIVAENLIKSNNRVSADNNTKIKIITHNAMDIIPLSWDGNGKITEVAFVDEYKEKDNVHVDLRLHIIDENKNYKIINKKIKVYGNDSYRNYEVLKNEAVLEEFNTGSNVPWFSVIKLPIVNSYDLTSPMGASVYGNALDILKNIDDAFTILCTEYRYGIKKVFYHTNLLQRNNEGKPIAPDDANKNIFFFMGDDYNSNMDAKDPIKEFNPQLRINDISVGIESALNYLSVMCGLGNSYYKFSAGAVQKTATEIVSENSSMYRNIRKNQLEVEKCVLELCKGLIQANNLLFGTNYNIECPISVNFDTSIIEDKVSIRNRDLQEVQLGIMSIDEYRAKYYVDGRRDNVPVIKE